MGPFGERPLTANGQASRGFAEFHALKSATLIQPLGSNRMPLRLIPA
jgi:hypothetical protein